MKILAPLLLVVATQLPWCPPQVPTSRPTITIREEKRKESDPPTVSARIVPSHGFKVTEVILEFGRRPSNAYAENIQYNSTPSDYNLPPHFTHILPTDQTFNATFKFSIPEPAARLRAGEVIDYQFKVIHESSSGSLLSVWSTPRQHLTVEPAEGSAPPQPPVSGISGGIDLRPIVSTPYVLTRQTGGEVVATKRGGMSRVNESFCAGLQLNTATNVPVPALAWGVQGVDAESVNTPFTVQLINNTDPTIPVTLATLTVPAGFAENNPVRQNNYSGRATSIRVILNPEFDIGKGQTILGCFTEPGTSPTLDPASLLIRVDPDNRIDEVREDNNDLSF